LSRNRGERGKEGETEKIEGVEGKGCKDGEIERREIN
jgi:hypothetical protein